MHLVNPETGRSLSRRSRVDESRVPITNLSRIRLSDISSIQYGGCLSGKRTLDKATRDLLATEKILPSKPSAVNGHVFLASIC